MLGKIVAIIPARYGSSRLPAKPLALIAGKPMLIHTLESVLRSKAFDAVAIATDHPDIQALVQLYYPQVAIALTSVDCPTGTHRVAEAIELLQWQDCKAVVNVQGDEPFIPASHLQAIVQLMAQENVEIGTLCRPATSNEEIQSLDKARVVMDINGRALYFSRAALPILKGLAEQDWLDAKLHKMHVGVYGFTPAILKQLIGYSTSPLEESEKLEQLTWLYHGHNIYVAEVNEISISVDTAQDLQKANQYFESQAQHPS